MRVNSRSAKQWNLGPLGAASAVALLAGLGMAAWPAQAAPSEASAINALQQQIEALQQQLDQLKAEQAASQEQIESQKQAIVAAQAEAAKPAPTPKGTKLVPNKLAIESADGRFSIGLTGRIHFDAGGYADYSPESGSATKELANAGVNARRARIGVAGTAFGDWSYALIYDAGGSADGSATIEDAHVSYGGIKDTSFDIGYTDTIFTADEAMSSNDIPFMERAVATNIAESFGTGDNRSEAGFRTWSKNWWLGVYATGPTSNSSHAGTQEQGGIFGRAAYEVVNTPDYSLHLGFGIDDMIYPPNAGHGAPDQISLADKPEFRIDTASLISTGSIGTLVNPVTGGQVYDAEIAGGVGSLFAQGEYYHYTLSRRGLTDNNFDGGYGEITYTLTGEHRKYKPDVAAYSGISPAEPFSLETGGMGAWELGARVSYIDMTDNYNPLAVVPDALNGGKALDFTLGLNWYVNNNIRFMFDWVHSRYMKDLPGGTGAGFTMDALGMRAQVNW